MSGLRAIRVMPLLARPIATRTAQWAIPLTLALSITGPASAADRYLIGTGVALVDILPPAPTAGSPQDVADRAAFSATRALAGSPRWAQAIGDVDERVPAILADFSPAAARLMSVEATPHLAALLARMRPDVATAVNAVKPVYARRRPFLVDDGAVCQPKAQLVGSFDYPSGHTSWAPPSRWCWRK